MNKSVLAIDIGSTKICAIIAEIDELGNILIVGSGTSKAQGLKKGSITTIDLAAKSIKNAISDAKRVAGIDLKSAIVSISGAYTKSINSSGVVNIPNKEVSIKEIERAMHSSLYNANILNEYEVLHVFPYNFKVDEQDFIEDPLGMNASRLEVETHVVTTQKSTLNNLKKAVRIAGIEVDGVLLSGYASAIAILNDDERELGVGVVDMGGSTSNIIIHAGNSIRYNDFLGVGSNHITSDLSMALHTPLTSADDVKIKYGTLSQSSNDLIELPIIGDADNTHEVSLEVVYNVIYARAEETLMIIAQSIEKSQLKESMGAGIILTGGFTKIEGIRDLAVAIFDNIPVRVAAPDDINGLFDTMKDPSYSTVIGLVKYSAGKITPYEIDVNRNMRYLGEDPTQSEPIALGDINRAFDTEIPKVKTKINDTLHNDLEEDKMISIPTESKKKNDEAGGVSKFWNWATQLF
ncbi:MAG: cell division protein FtsA [Campylobacterota bacterium]|nr:cell division protein FtsA [Campylobacterota bacterium]